VGKRNIKTERERLAELLRQMRAEADLRQIDLAAKLGEPQSYVSRYESGEQRLDLIELNAICKAVGVTLTELVRRFEEAR
jgi:transcriptional regulator with XRE-family HTH domain